MMQVSKLESHVVAKRASTSRMRCAIVILATFLRVAELSIDIDVMIGGKNHRTTRRDRDCNK